MSKGTRIDVLEFVTETDKAFLVNVKKDGKPEEIWIPFSCCFEIHKNKPKSRLHKPSGWIKVNEWWAKKIGLGEDEEEEKDERRYRR